MQNTAVLKQLLQLLFLLFIAAAVLLFVGSLPPPQQVVALVFALTIALWATEALPLYLPAVASPLLLALLEVFGWESLLRSFFDPLIGLFVGSFIIAGALSASRLDERLALKILSYPWAVSTPFRLLFSLGLITSLLSLLISNTAVTAFMLPIGLRIIAALPLAPSSYRIGILLMLTWGSSVAVGFIIGSPPNLIGTSILAANTGSQIGFVRWASFALPLNAAMLLLGTGLLYLLYGRAAPDTSSVVKLAAKDLHALGPLAPNERVLVRLLCVLLPLLVLPEALSLLPGNAPWVRQLAAIFNPTWVMLGGAATLLFLPSAKMPVLKIRLALKIDWGTILLFAGGIALGRAAFESGLAGSIGSVVIDLAGQQGKLGMMILATYLAIAISELVSNTAAATLVVPLVLSLCQASGISPEAPVLAAALGTSFGFMMPISTPPNSIVYSSKLVPGREMMRAGLIFDLLGGIVTIAVLRALLPLCGLW